jgi:hypothetical protein
MTQTGNAFIEEERTMTYEYDFEMVKRAYAEMARRAREKDEVRRLPRDASPAQQLQQEQEAFDHQPFPA